MSQLIEEYLNAAGVRYFRGHHDDEYVFLAGDRDRRAGRGPLHVHLEQGRFGEIAVTVTPARYFPAAQRERLAEVADRWFAGVPGMRAAILRSSDAERVGVVVASIGRPADARALAALVDGTVSSAIDLFRQMRRMEEPAPLRDAG